MQLDGARIVTWTQPQRKREANEEVDGGHNATTLVLFIAEYLEVSTEGIIKGEHLKYTRTFDHNKHDTRTGGRAPQQGYTVHKTRQENDNSSEVKHFSDGRRDMMYLIVWLTCFLNINNTENDGSTHEARN